MQSGCLVHWTVEKLGSRPLYTRPFCHLFAENDCSRNAENDTGTSSLLVASRFSTRASVISRNGEVGVDGKAEPKQKFIPKLPRRERGSQNSVYNCRLLVNQNNCHHSPVPERMHKRLPIQPSTNRSAVELDLGASWGAAATAFLCCSDLLTAEIAILI